MIQGAIFDLDGTLLDSMQIWDTIAGDYLSSLGCEIKRDINDQVKNMSLHQAACFMKEECRLDLSVREITEGVNALVEKSYRDAVQLKSGVFDFIQTLSMQNVKMCIATATDRYQVEMALRRCGVLSFFSEIFTCTEVGHGKDSPVIFREALHYLGTPKDKTVVFEDALFALKTAKNDDFITAAVYDAYEPMQDQVQSLANISIMDYFHTDEFWKFAAGL